MSGTCFLLKNENSKNKGSLHYAECECSPALNTLCSMLVLETLKSVDWETTDKL